MLIEIVGNILIILLLLLWQDYRVNKGIRILYDWADNNDYKVESCKFKLYFKGPFFLNSGMITLVYKVSLLDSEGYSKECWIRVGEGISGMLFNKNVYIKWL